MIRKTAILAVVLGFVFAGCDSEAGTPAPNTPPASSTDGEKVTAETPPEETVPADAPKKEEPQADPPPDETGSYVEKITLDGVQKTVDKPLDEFNVSIEPASFEMVAVPSLGLWVGKTEVTFDVYQCYFEGSIELEDYNDIARPSMPYEPQDSLWGMGKRPAIIVTVQNARAFCNWLARVTGHAYRLPTEEEWKKFAGAKPENIDEYGWHEGNTTRDDNDVTMTQEVAGKKPNELGLYDVFGNVAELVDPAEGEPVAVLGGSIRDGGEKLGPDCREEEDNILWKERDSGKVDDNGDTVLSPWWYSDGQFVGFRIVREMKK